MRDFLEKYLGGHISIGNITIYGWNAMHVAIQIWTKRWGFICFHPPGRLLGYGKRCPWYFYISPNATPWGASFGFGPGIDREDKLRIYMRRNHYARCWNCDKHKSDYCLQEFESQDQRRYKNREEECLNKNYLHWRLK